jgi:hypothetical protein
MSNPSSKTYTHKLLTKFKLFFLLHGHDRENFVRSCDDEVFDCCALCKNCNKKSHKGTAKRCKLFDKKRLWIYIDEQDKFYIFYSTKDDRRYPMGKCLEWVKYV